MTPLDEVTARCFPTLAKFARRQWWLGALGVVIMLCSLSFAGGVMVGSYQGKVSQENYHAVVGRINDLEREYGKHHSRSPRIAEAKERP